MVLAQGLETTNRQAPRNEEGAIVAAHRAATSASQLNVLQNYFHDPNEQH
jgi:hypothetical protein